ncbi:MAG: hypothetical protein KUG65_08775, partial [Sphingomonadaceae bacterium]|nr:hypothetical protein [Sphingomonadaceae bacterium]
IRDSPFLMTMRPLSAAAKSVTADSSRSAEMDSASKSSAKQTTGTDVRPIITLRIPQVERISGKANPLVIPARQIEARADISVTGLDQRLADGAKAAGQDVLAKDTEGKVDPAHKAPAGHPARSVVAKPDVEQPVTARPAAREIDGVQPRAAEPQPLLALREAQPGLPGAMARQSASPTSAAPAGPQDFAALIDRLVEARDAAAPQTVKASIAHDEFGHIALRFKQLDGNLSVSMKSADPGFTAAVQSASAAGQAAGSGENGANSSRHDGSQAQQGGAAFGQSQSNTQANAQGSTRDGNRGEPRSATGRSAQETGGTDHGENQQDASSGIYA